LAGEHTEALEAIQYLLTSGELLGYLTHMKDKGKILIGQCGSLIEAIKKKDDYIKLGFHPNIIVIHPKDYELAIINDDDINDEEIKVKYQRESKKDISKIKIKYGANVLGGNVGCDEYIINQLKIKIEQLTNEADKLIKYDNIQQRHLLLIYCFSPKINHILRTTYPRLTVDLCESFDRLQKRILCSILGQYDEASLPEEIWKHACLSLNEGGIGIRSATSIAKVAFLASAVDCLDSTQSIYPPLKDALQINSEDECTVQYASEMRKVIEYINGIQTKDQNEPITLDSVKEMGKVTKDKQAIEKRQHELTLLLEKSRKSEFIKTISFSKIAWITSASCDSASRWLGVAPKSPVTTFSSHQFRILVNLRLYLEQPELNSGQCCNCKSRRGNNSAYTIMDLQCLHCLTCPKNGLGIRIHNGMNLQLNALCNATGLKTKVEPHGCFNTIESIGRYTDKEMNTRPDVLIFKAISGRHDVIVDTSITSPTTITSVSRTMTIEESIIPDRAGGVLYKKKNDKYYQIAKDNHLELKTFLFETTGRIYHKSMDFLSSSILNRFNSAYKNGFFLKKYWLDRISCTFQRHCAIEIGDKLKYLNGIQFTDVHYENRNDFINGLA